MHKEEMVEKKPNHLIHEKSPYLQQHAYNPVNWYPWGKEAFEKAKREDKPVFLSIGYSTCHWCHVMERESFENGEIAGIMNEYFVSIKVDREERPDIDNVYMAAAQAMTGGGGWPLSIFMTPGKKPFYSGTYFPPHDVYGRMGFRSVLTVVARQWKTDKKNIVETGENIALSLGKFNELHSRSKGDSIKEDIFEQAFTARKNQFEPQYGGFSEGTKFPMGHGLSFLLRYYHRTGDSSALHMVTHTLDNMSAGGIYDHLGGGFHRYSTDRYWLAPHFEKMLYDQALLVLAYLEAFQVTGKERYARIVRETIEYVVRDMMHTEGGFYSAEDADSEGKEGKFYVWDREEILSLLGEKEGTLFCEFYGVEKEGNFEGHTILTAGEPEEQFAKRKDIPATQLSQQLKKNRELLFVHRSKRIRPHLDDKIMTDWNGLMISALSYASMVLNDSSYVEAAEKSAGFILRRLQRKDGRLLKHWRDSPASNLGLVEDYAFFINGLVDLYAATFDVKWLYEAKRLAGDFKRLFWDDNHGGFFLTPKDMEQLFTNPKELYDGAIPSGNSVGAYALIRLGHLLQDNQYTILAYDLFMAFSGQINKSPEAFPMLLIALDYAREIKKEVVIAGNRNNSDVREFLGKLYEQFQPGTVVILRESGENGKHIAGLVPFVKNQETVNGKSTFYVCKNYTCNLPTNNVEEAVRLIGE